MIDDFLDNMKNQGWTVEMNEEQKFWLPEPMKSRDTGCPKSWVGFVSTVKRQRLLEFYQYSCLQDAAGNEWSPPLGN
jgi:hypothetical protein